MGLRPNRIRVGLILQGAWADSVTLPTAQPLRPAYSGLSIHQEFFMAIYELRTYNAIVGKMSELTSHYKNEGWPVLSKHPSKLVGYFTGDVGALNQLIHIWKFDDDADRRAFWAGVYGDADFMAFAAKIRPLIAEQQNKLMLSAPWGPQP
jgi:hypothetical protein